MKTMFLSITAGQQESLWVNSGLVTTDQKIVPFLNYILSVTISLILTGRLQNAHVTERQSGQTNLFWRGFAINPEEH